MMGLIYFTVANFLLTLVAAVLCVCFAPTAAGPGIPEIKAYLNGVDTPNMFGATTLFVKVSTKLVIGILHFLLPKINLNKKTPNHGVYFSSS